MNLTPEFFDIFGALAFIFITGSALYAIKTKQQLPRWVLFVLLLIGVLGLIVDGIIVFTTYF